MTLRTLLFVPKNPTMLAEGPGGGRPPTAYWRRELTGLQAGWSPSPGHVLGTALLLVNQGAIVLPGAALLASAIAGPACPADRWPSWSVAGWHLRLLWPAAEYGLDEHRIPLFHLPEWEKKQAVLLGCEHRWWGVLGLGWVSEYRGLGRLTILDENSNEEAQP